MKIKWFLAVAAMSLSLFYAEARAQSQQQLDATLDTFKDMSPEERQQMLNMAMDAFEKMPADQKQALLEEAKAHAQNLTETQKNAYQNQWQNVLTPQQKAALMQQLQKQGVTPESLASPSVVAPSVVAPSVGTPAVAAQPSSSDVLRQLQSLPPGERQKILNQLQAAPQAKAVP